MKKPEWYYKPIVVPELDIIQDEVNKFLPTLISKQQEIGFYYIKRDQIETLFPCYTAMLEKLGLLDRWTYSAILATEGRKEFPIHVDAIDWENRCFGLNIPILNCENSWTVWYDADIDLSPTTDDYDPRNSARFCSSKNAVELCRMPASTPAWINISKPHRPVTEHNQLRAIISARFSPEVHDILDFTIDR
jgi:hypothetical protein